ncbi:MAG: DUF5305 family protein, partial [archaeon]
MTEWATRLRAIVADHVVVLVVVLLAIAGVGGALAVTSEPTTTTDYRSETLERGIGTFEHEATVIDGGSVFENGSTLRNRSAYFTGVAPVLNGTFVYTYETDSDGPLRTTVRTRLVLHAVEETDDGKTTEYWRRTRTLDQTETTLAPGAEVRSNYSVNVSAIEQRLASIRETIGRTPGRTEVLVVATVQVEGTLEDHQVGETRRYEQRIVPSGDLYRVESSTSDDETTVRVPVTRTNDPQMRRYLGYLLAVVGGIGGLGVLAVVGFAGGTDAIAPEERTRERRRYARQRSEYDEWITGASLPLTVRDRPRIEVESLEGLVDVAIDTDERVLEADDGPDYYVLGDDVLYVYRPPAETGRRLEPTTDPN